MSRPITALVPWYGSNRTLAENVGKALAGCEWVGVPFAGGMCELRHIDARTVVVGDLHRLVINLANVLKDPRMGAELIRTLRRLPFHEDTLAKAQDQCRAWGKAGWGAGSAELPIALQYFVSAWMGRSGTAGTDAELGSALSVRWEAGGGDSAKRFRSAVEALRDWRSIMYRCTFVVRDVFDFLRDVKDLDGHGVYCDPPFPGPGDKYTHTFDDAKQRRLADELANFKRCRVVCRYYDHPLVRGLFPEDRWEWQRREGRTQANGVGPEVLIRNRLECA